MEGREGRKERGKDFLGLSLSPTLFSLHWPKEMRVSRLDGRGELTVSHLT